MCAFSLERVLDASIFLTLLRRKLLKQKSVLLSYAPPTSYKGPPWSRRSPIILSYCLAFFQLVSFACATFGKPGEFWATLSGIRFTEFICANAMERQGRGNEWRIFPSSLSFCFLLLSMMLSWQKITSKLDLFAELETTRMFIPKRNWTSKDRKSEIRRAPVRVRYRLSCIGVCSYFFRMRRRDAHDGLIFLCRVLSCP